VSGRQRAVILILAAVVAVAAFLVLRPEDEGDAPEPAQTGQPRATPAVPDEETAPRTQPETRAREPQEIRVRGGKPVGGIQTIEAEEGDTVRFRVITETPQEIHLHGYDITRNTTGSRPTAEFRVRADETGIFELEVHGTRTQIAELKVEP
jgi:FtsP/CotA-like multicopper oxidase with cupredoxin domain